MKKIGSILFVFCLSFISCKKETRQIENDNQIPKPLEKAAMECCYEYVQGKDTIQAIMSIQSDTVKGNLSYNLFEKDKNKGSIIGLIKGDTLLAEYTFMSEGVKSVRQVVFLRKNKTLIEGFGATQEKEGKMIFKDIKSLDFSSNIVLNEIPCH